MRAVFARPGLFVSMLVASLGAMLTASSAFAQEAAAHGANNPHAGMMTLALALGAGLATLGGTYGQSKAATAALEGIARNPNAADQMFVPMLLSLALIESLTLATWVLMFLLRTNI